jgi:signal transduction histidine kinase
MSASQTETVPEGHVGARRRILLVEDDTAICASLSELLGEEGYDVTNCGDGRTALEVLRDAPIPPDLILLDLMMPVMDGWEFRTRQRKDPALADIPVVVVSADGSSRATAIHADGYLRKPLRADELLRVVSRVIADRDSRRALDRIEHTQRLAALGMLAAGVGHDINNALTGVLTSLSLAERSLPAVEGDVAVIQGTPLTPPAQTACQALADRLSATRSLLGEAHASSDRVLAIAGNLRRFVRRPEGQLSIIDLRDVAAGAVQVAISQIRSRAKLVTQLEEEAAVRGDYGQLTQVLVNLLLNAAQALPAQGRAGNVVRVGVKREGGQSIVEVQDNGPGIRPEVMPRLFEPFFTTKPDGTGLGLAICRSIAELHGGSIEVESRPGEGACFRLSLPLVPTPWAPMTIP